MTIQTYIMILLNHRVLVPESWVGFIQSSVDFETLTLSQYRSLADVPNLVSALDVERYAAFTEINYLLQQGKVVLTQHGSQQLEMFWC
jgi:hypothetical protein